LHGLQGLQGINFMALNFLLPFEVFEPLVGEGCHVGLDGFIE